MKTLFKGKIRKQLIIAVALVHAVMMALFVWDLTYRQKSLLLENQTDQAHALARTIATSSAGWLGSRDLYGLQEIISKQTTYPELLFAMVLDNTGKVLAHSDSSRLGQYVVDLPEEAKLQTLSRNASLVDVISPVRLSGQKIGWIRVGLGQEKFANRLSHITRDGVLYAIVAILIGSVFAGILGTQLTRKLNHINQVAHAVQRGQIQRRAGLSGSDEVSEVAMAFDDMLDVLQQTQDDLLEAQERVYLAKDAARIGIWDYDLARQEMIWDDWMYRLFGISETPVNSLLATWQGLLHPDDRTPVNDALEMAINHQRSFETEFRIIRPAGQQVWISASASVVLDEEGQAIRLVGTARDITRRREQDRLIAQQANYDALTSLPNRKMLEQLLRQQIRTTDEKAETLWMMFLDLDDFKEINDSYGHPIGDALLMRVAERLQASIAEPAVLSRHGGDEFVILLTRNANSFQVEQKAQQILEDMSQPYNIADKEIFVTASIGIANYPNDAVNAHDLLRFADQSMFDAKRLGKNRYRLFTEELQQASKKRLETASNLRQALQNEEFFLVYQPIVELSTGNVHKAEALIRWQQPDKGLISPAEFIPVAEETGLINEMGCWIYDQAFGQLKKWCSPQRKDFQLSINLSPYQLSISEKNYRNWLKTLDEFGLKGECVVVEITEGLMLKNDPLVNRRLLEYGEAGVQVAIDDFGTGYSSLAYLKEFDIDYLKIDQSFVRNLEAGSTEEAIPRAIIVMAHQLGLKVIAEGVETEAQRDILRDMGCDYAQGYLFSKPVQADEFESRFLI